MVFTGVQIFAMKSNSSIESYPYEVIKKYDGFEIRKYEARLFTSVNLGTSDYKKGSSSGFSVLAGYIFGGNKTKEKIAMTSPVAMSLGDTMTMMFLVPEKFNRESLPKPNTNNIEFKDMPQMTVAAIRFGGWASNEKIEKYKNELIAQLEQQGIKHSNRFSFLGYNPPFEVFNRRNEVIVELLID